LSELKNKKLLFLSTYSSSSDIKTSSYRVCVTALPKYNNGPYDAKYINKYFAVVSADLLADESMAAKFVNNHNHLQVG
jgi:hypothetical protein